VGKRNGEGLKKNGPIGRLASAIFNAYRASDLMHELSDSPRNTTISTMRRVRSQLSEAVSDYQIVQGAHAFDSD